MNNILEILQTFRIGSMVATFLFNTGRIEKAVDIFNECLVLLNGKSLETIKELTTPLVIYVTITTLIFSLLKLRMKISGCL